MQSHVGHPGLVSDKVEARAYQLQAVDDAMAGSTLLILPTAAGKTAVAWMSIVERMEQSMGWALVIAPTVALSNQHLENALPVLSKTDEWNPIVLSGQQTASKRPELWNGSKLVFATPQVVRNDVANGVLSLEECCLLVVDEAHHCTGEHAMAAVSYTHLTLPTNREV